MLVPLVSLGRRAVATEGTGARASTFAMRLADEAAGGHELRATGLSCDLFKAEAMRAVDRDLMAMKVDELKEELEARDEVKTGNKAWLRCGGGFMRRSSVSTLRECRDPTLKTTTFTHLHFYGEKY